MLNALTTMPLAAESIYILPDLDDPVFVTVVLLACLLGFVTFFSPRIGLLIMLLASLFGSEIEFGGGVNVTGDTRGAGIRIEDVLLIVMSFGWLANRARTRTLLIVRRTPVNRAILLMAIAMIAATAMGLIQGTTPIGRGTLYTLKRLEYFWMFYMALHIIEGYKGCRRCVELLYIATAVISLYGIFVVLIATGTESQLFTEGGLSSTTGAGRANTFSSFLFIAISLALARICYAEKRGTIIRNSLILGMFLVTLVLTQSRAAYVCIVPLILTIFFLTKSRRILVMMVISAVLATAFAFSVFMMPGPVGMLADKRVQNIQMQVESIFKVAREGLRSDSSMAVRLDAWKYAWGETKKYPIFGNGVGSTSLGHIDNQYVRELMDTGFVGLICFLIFIGVAMKSTYELFLVTEDRFVKSLTAAFLTAMVTLLIHAMTIANFYTILVMETVCVMLAFLMILYQATFYPETETTESELAVNPQSPEDAAGPVSPGHPQ